MQFDPITYNEARALREHFRIIYGSYDATLFVFDPAVTGSSLQTWLGTQANLDAFKQLLATYIGPAAVIASSTAMAAVIASSTAMAAVAASSTAMAAVAASSTAMAAVAASSTAMAAVIASSTAMAAVIASSTAMAAVIASSTAMAAVAASSTAKTAIHGSDTALNAIKASSTAMAALRAAAGYVLSAAITVSSQIQIAAFVGGGTYILLGVSSSNTPGSAAIRVDNLRSGSGISNTNLMPATPGSDGKTLNLAIPLVGPYTATNTASSGYSWYFGAIRCDV